MSRKLLLPLAIIFTFCLSCKKDEDKKNPPMPFGIHMVRYVQCDGTPRLNEDTTTSMVDYEKGEMNSIIVMNNQTFKCTIDEIGRDRKNHAISGGERLYRYRITFDPKDTIYSKYENMLASELNSDHYFYYSSPAGRSGTTAHDGSQRVIGLMIDYSEKDFYKEFTKPTVHATTFWFKI